MIDSAANEQHVRFLPAAQASGERLVSFRDPYAACAVAGPAPDGASHAELAFVLALAPLKTPSESFDVWAQRTCGDGVAAIAVKVRGSDVWWCPAAAMLRCEPQDAEALRAAVLQFIFYEWELKKLEAEVADSWDTLDADRRLACTVTAADLRQSDAFASRMSNALGRRIRFARLQPHLLNPDTPASDAAESLGSGLREEADTESRAEALDAQLAVFEQIYELASPRMGESRDAHEGQRIEWIIIWLLIAEVALSLVQVLLKRS